MPGFWVYSGVLIIMTPAPKTTMWPIHTVIVMKFMPFFRFGVRKGLFFFRNPFLQPLVHEYVTHQVSGMPVKNKIIPICFQWLCTQDVGAVSV